MISRHRRTLAAGALAAMLLGPCGWQSATAQPADPEIERAQEVRDALNDPVLRPPGRTLRDIGVPTRSLTLQDALRRALTNHPDLRIALANIEAQEFGVIAATAPRYPSLSFDASTGQSGSRVGASDFELARSSIQRSYGFGISLNQQLIDFGRTHYRVRQAELGLTATRLDYIQTRQIVINNVVQAYFNLLRQAQAIEVGLENVRNAELLVEQARGFLEAGTRAKIELIRAEAGLANAQFLVVQAEGGYGRALAALASALGEDELPNELPEAISLDVPDWDVGAVRSLARRSRPDLIISSLRVAQAEAEIGAARAEYYPRISASASYNWSDALSAPVNTGYNVGLNMSVPLYNEPALSSAVGQAEANKKAAEATRKSTELQVVQDATEALYTLRESSGSSEAARVALRASEENFRLATERYRVGVGNSLEVSEAQRLLVQARGQELQARYDVQNSIANLLRATGQLDSEAVLAADLRIDPVFELPEEVLPEADEGYLPAPGSVPEMPASDTATMRLRRFLLNRAAAELPAEASPSPSPSPPSPRP